MMITTVMMVLLGSMATGCVLVSGVAALSYREAEREIQETR